MTFTRHSKFWRYTVTHSAISSLVSRRSEYIHLLILTACRHLWSWEELQDLLQSLAGEHQVLIWIHTSCARMRHAGQHLGPILRRADALWILSMNVYVCKLPWRLYPLVERDPRKRIWLDGISTPALKVQLGWTLRRTYARIRTYRLYTRAELYAGSMNGSAYARVYARTKYESSLKLDNFDLPTESRESLQMELDRWVVRWSRAVGEKPTDILDTLDNTVEILYPSIYRAPTDWLDWPWWTFTGKHLQLIWTKP